MGEDTTFSQIIQMVSDAAATKAPIAKAADRVSGIFVPAVIGISLVTAVGWLMSRTELLALHWPVEFPSLLSAAPARLGLATPVAIMVGNGVGAKNGILFKTAAALEEAGRTEIIALDKTGTITMGEPHVTDLLPAPGVTEDQLLSLAAALEKKSEHPLARSVMRKAEELGLEPEEAEEFEALVGSGVSASLKGRKLLGGSLSFMSGRI